MTIHHATVKRAANLGFAIDEHNEGETFLTCAEPAFTLWGSDDLAKAMVDAASHIKMAIVEHGLTVDQPERGEGDYSVQMYYADEPVGDAFAFEDAEEGAFNAALAKPEGADEEEAEVEKRTVVPDVYKARYAAMGHPNTCGDWLALILNGICLTPDGFQVDPMLAICEANGVDAEAYLRRKTRGWQGRFRMSARNKLKGVVAKAGLVLIPDGVDEEGARELNAPADWIAANTPKAKGVAALAA
jgi:hypothetical protein